MYEHELLREGSAVRGKGCAKKIKTQKRKLCLHYFIIHIMMDWNNVVLLETTKLSVKVRLKQYSDW